MAPNVAHPLRYQSSSSTRDVREPSKNHVLARGSQNGPHFHSHDCKGHETWSNAPQGGAEKTHNEAKKRRHLRLLRRFEEERNAVKMAAEVEGPPRWLKSFHRGPFFSTRSWACRCLPKRLRVKHGIAAGFHVLVYYARGKVPRGTRSGAFTVYLRKRPAAFTGNLDAVTPRPRCRALAPCVSRSFCARSETLSQQFWYFNLMKLFQLVSTRFSVLRWVVFQSCPIVAAANEW